MRHPPGHAICGCHWWSSINRRYREFPLQSLPHRQCLFHSCQSLNAESRIQPKKAFGAFASLLKIVDGNMLELFVAALCSCCVPCQRPFIVQVLGHLSRVQIMADAEDQRHGNVSLSSLALKKVGHADETKPKHPSKKKGWEPWKDRLADHADTVLFIQAFLDPLQDSEFTRQNVMTVSADGVVTVYHLHLATSNPKRHGGFRLGQVANIESITCLTSDTAPVSAAWCNSRTIETPPPPSVCMVVM